MERLTDEQLKEKYDYYINGGTNSANFICDLLTEIQQSRAEIERLRDALKVYADKDSWMAEKIMGDFGRYTMETQYVWDGVDKLPFTAAQKALEGEAK